jgi:hypothetical protein
MKVHESPTWVAFFKGEAAFYGSAGVPVLGSPQMFLYEDHSLFFDTPYHLTQRGKRIRTSQLIALLRPYFGAGDPALLDHPVPPISQHALLEAR